MITGQNIPKNVPVRLKSIGFIGGLINKVTDDNKANIFYQSNNKSGLSGVGKSSHFRCLNNIH